ncbi:MAG: helix-turn-helix domain-containing protein [Ignavibacteriaceae bacterium]|nr:helix-turn-helix domain-containing protein [Ignavibacteriaceae bacterium]
MAKYDKNYCTRQMKETFGEYVKRLRTENNLTLTQLAAQLDLDSANLSKIENGKRAFDEKRLIKLANFFKLNMDKLKTEFFSDLIAKKIYQTKCCHETLLLAEEKIKYLQQKEIKTGVLNL